ncbi:hypothetical protein WGT02_34545 (plasmid) [Rhizobium sp. T1470]|uniref:hypothetical protein n=1 Tax=unclassified Rhizobium TaxID=2613769 RepID=UPI001AAE3C25|nr:hypothetical protein [Rhizobium sp. T1473]MCA0806734.1 hypothetical protein [Rhizobium sp. T1473]
MPKQDDPATFADRLSAMTDDEVFLRMQDLEKQSEALSRARMDLDDILAFIALVETEIERRFPGQALQPYKEWQRKGSE